MKMLCVCLVWVAFAINLVEMKKPRQATGIHLENNSEGKRKFTHEWQEIDDNEAVPAGHHYRLNLATGKKEVKLLDEEDTAKTSLAVMKETEVTLQEGNQNSDLKNRLKNIPVEEINPTTEQMEKVTRKFRPYEELKKEFESLKMSVKTDLEVMDELFTSYHKMMEKRKAHTMEDLGNLNILSPPEESHLSILTDLEYMVHQVDNAKQFVLNEGLTMIVYPSLNSSSSVIRTEAARLLGSAVQNNPPSQIKALEEGALGVVLRVLALDPVVNVRSAALYAVSCLVRRFPLAQQQMVNQGGVAVLASLFDGDSGEQLKLQVKVVTFIDDLLVERHDALVTQLEALSSNNTSAEKDQANERLRQYKQVDLDKALEEHVWCQHVVKLFKRELASKSMLDLESVRGENSPDLDVVEKLTKAMVSLAEPCRRQFLSDPSVDKLLLSLIHWLKTLSLEEEGEADGYYTALADQLRLLASRLGIFHTNHPLPDLL